MKRLKSGVYHMMVPIYEQRVYIATSSNAMDAQFGGGGIGEGMIGEVGRLTDDNTGLDIGVYICLDCHSVNTLAHECTHLAFRILERAGIRPTADEHEALAYLVGWLAEKVQSVIDKEAK